MLKTKFQLIMMVCLALVIYTGRVLAITVSATYVKSLGQSNEDGNYFISTGGGRIAVDEAGNAYFGTPGGSSYLQKVSSKGRIIWQFYTGALAFQGTAVDAKYLYTCGRGDNGRIQLQRWLRDTGAPAPGWQYDWENNSKSLNGVLAPKLPYALAVDDIYVFLVDKAGNEIRRFNKASGTEEPFKNRLSVVSPTDIVLTPTGSLLILSEDAVVEVGADGAPLKVPYIANLSGPTAIDINRKTGALYVAEGGCPQELINRVRIYGPDGRLQDEIGIGGEFSGHWHPNSFAFSSGAGDITLDADGGLWVNGYGARMDLCPTLVHITPRNKADLVLRGVSGYSIAVDPDLDVYVGGSYKVGWDGELKWTSGLVSDGPLKLFPTTPNGWLMSPLWSDGKTVLVASVHQNLFYQINAKNGAALGKSVPTDTYAIVGRCVVGNDVFFSGIGQTVERTSLNLEPPQLFATLPESANVFKSNLLVGPDKQLFYVSTGGLDTTCYRRDGTVVWKAPCNAGVLANGVLFGSSALGNGVDALDAATGTKLLTFGDREEDGRPPFSTYGPGFAVGSKDGVQYLFIHARARVLVYKIEIN